MKAEIIPLVVVKDVPANVKYLENAFKFELSRQSYAGEFAVLEYRGAALMLKSRKLYERGQNVPLEEHSSSQGIEILVRIEKVMDVYSEAVNKGAAIITHLHSVADTREAAVRRFSAALPEGHTITFFEYVGPNT